MSSLRTLFCAAFMAVLAACQTTETVTPASAPKPINLSKVSGTYNCTYQWIGYSTHGSCTERYKVSADGATTVTGTWNDSKGRSGSHELHGTIDAKTGRLKLAGTTGGQYAAGKPFIEAIVSQRADNSVVIQGTISMGPDKARYMAE